MRNNIKRLSVYLPEDLKPNVDKRFASQTSLPAQLTSPREPSGKLKIAQSVKELLEKEKKKLPDVNSGRYPTRDVSHLKDKHKRVGSPFYMPLPTDIETLGKQLHFNPRTTRHSHGNLLCTRDSCIETATAELPVKFDKDTVDRYFLGSPTGRQQIENLTSWYKEMKERYQNEGNDQLIIEKMCLRELIRQVSVQCVERGQLLRDVLESYENLHTNKYETFKTRSEKNAKKHRKELAGLTEAKNMEKGAFKVRIIQLENTIEEMTENEKDNKNHLRELQEEIKLLKEANLQLEKENNEIKTLTIIEPAVIPSCSMKSSRRSHTKDPDDNEISLVNQSVKEPPSQLGAPTGSPYATRRYSVKEKPFKACRLLRTDSSLIIERPYHHTTDHYSSFHLLRTEAPVVLPNRTFREHSQEILPDQDYEDLIKDEILDLLPDDAHINSWTLGFAAGFEKGRMIGNEEGELFSKDNSEKESQDFTEEHPVQRPTAFNEEGTLGLREAFNEEAIQSHRPKGVDTKTNPRFYRSNTKLFDNGQTARNFSRKLPSPQTFRKSRRVTKFAEFKWKRKSLLIPSFKKLNFGSKVLVKMLERSVEWIKRRGYMSEKLVNKIIYSAYTSALAKTQEIDSQRLVETTYDDFLNKHGLHTVADRKFIDLIGSLFRYRNSRVRTFIKIIGVGYKFELTDFSTKTINFFFSSYQYMLNAKIGISVVNDDTSRPHMVPAIRGLEFLKEKCEKLLDSQTLSSLQNWVERHSVTDIRKVNPHGLINSDRFLLNIAEVYQEFHQIVQDDLYSLFEGIMTDFNYVTNAELHIILRGLGCRNLQDSDPERTYTFDRFTEKVLSVFPSKEIKGIIKGLTFEENLQENTTKLLEENYSTLLKNYDASWNSLAIETIAQRLRCLAEDREDLNPLTYSFAWKIYSLELHRLLSQLN